MILPEPSGFVSPGCSFASNLRVCASTIIYFLYIHTNVLADVGAQPCIVGKLRKKVSKGVSAHSVVCGLTQKGKENFQTLATTEEAFQKRNKASG